MAQRRWSDNDNTKEISPEVRVEIDRVLAGLLTPKAPANALQPERETLGAKLKREAEGCDATGTANVVNLDEQRRRRGRGGREL